MGGTGWQFLRDAYEIKKEIEAEYQALLGEEEMKQLRVSLMRLLERDDMEKPMFPIAG